MKLKQIVNIQAGYPFRGKVVESPAGDACVVQMKDVSANGSLGHLDWDHLVKAELTGRKAPVWLRQDHVLFVARGSRNFAIHVNQTPKAAVCGQLFFLLTIKPEYQNQVLAEFVAWLINSTQSQRYFDADAQGVTQSYAQRNITRSVLENLPIILPSITAQLQMTQLFEAARREKETYLALIANRQQELGVLTAEFYHDHQSDQPHQHNSEGGEKA